MTSPKPIRMFSPDSLPTVCKTDLCQKPVAAGENLCHEHLKIEKQGMLGWCKSCNARMENASKLGNNCSKCARRQNPSVNRRLKKKHGYELIKKQEGRCSYCQTEITTENGTQGNKIKAEIEHKVPRSKGGRDNLENIHLTCTHCNREKGTSTHQAFEAHKNFQTHIPLGENLTKRGQLKPKNKRNRRSSQRNAPPKESPARSFLGPT